MESLKAAAENSQNGGRERKYWLDAIRGMAMLFVIFGHQCRGWTVYYVLTSAVKVSLFFVISGYLFNVRDGNTGAFLKNLFFKIIIPYFILSLLPLKLIYAIIKGNNIIPEWKRYFHAFLCGENMWYMPCCIVAEVIHFLIRKYCKNKAVFTCVCIGFTAMGLFLGHQGIGNYAFINTACTAQGFLALGMLISKKEMWITERRKWFLPATLLLYGSLIVLTFLLYPGQSMDVKWNRYYSYPVCLSLIAVGSAACFIGFKWIGDKKRIWKNNPLVFIGQNTLVFYIMHHYVKSVFVRGLNLLHITIPEGPASWLSYTIAICIGCTVLSVLINRFFPFAVGKKRIPAL